MKYSSRLMTLLMALMLCIAFNSTALAATYAISNSDGTGVDSDAITGAEEEAISAAETNFNVLKALGTTSAIYEELLRTYDEDSAQYAAYAEALNYAAENQYDEIICLTCAENLVSQGTSKWPVSDSYTCLYTYLDGLGTDSARYDYLNNFIVQYNTAKSSGDTTVTAYYESLNMAYINLHYAHASEDGWATLICNVSVDNCSVYSQWSLVQPGGDHTGTCPWADEVYTPSLPAVTPSPDISTPEALKNVTTVTLTAPATGTYVWQKSVYPVSDTSWVAMDGETSSTLVLEIKAETIQYAYRCIITTTADDGTVTTTTTAPFFLGGEEFLAWIYTATGVLNWLKNDTSMEYIIVAYENYLLGIALSEVIYLTNGTLIELEGGTTLALLDENNQLIDVRYKLAVAQVVDGAIVPLN